MRSRGISCECTTSHVFNDEILYLPRSSSTPPTRSTRTVRSHLQRSARHYQRFESEIAASAFATSRSTGYLGCLVRSMSSCSQIRLPPLPGFGRSQGLLRLRRHQISLSGFISGFSSLLKTGYRQTLSLLTCFYLFL